MKQYKELVSRIVNEGQAVPDRTGTGTRKVFGHQMRFNLQEGFPLVTLKRTFFRGALEELLWFLRGSTSVKELQARKVFFWDEWQDEDGGIGHGYGKQFRRLESYTPVVPKLYEAPEIAAINFGPLPEADLSSDTGKTAIKVGDRFQSKTCGELVVLKELPADQMVDRIHWLVGFSDTGYTKIARYRDILNASVKDPYRRSVHQVGYYGNADKDDPHYALLVSVWRDMLGRCYDENDGAYQGYGAKGVHVAPEWHCFATFLKDAQTLPGWTMKLEYPKDFSIDKDSLWASNRYAKHTCRWASAAVQSANLSNTAYFTAVSPEGETVKFTSTGDANRTHGLNVSAVHRCLTGKLKTHHGWSDFQYVETPAGSVLRYDEVDQLKQLIAGLRHNPFSRRHLMTLWNPFDLDRTTLPPCHGSVVQFDVAPDPFGGKPILSCMMYQRSADVFLGVPVNLAVYSLLTHMIAYHLGYQVGDFIWTGGDCHLYSNHADQVQELLQREPLPLPRIELNYPASTPLEEVEPTEITLHDYQHHSALAAPVAV